MEKFNSFVDKFNDYLESEKFEKKFDKFCWWFLGFTVLYFTTRIILSVVWDI